MSPCVKWRQTQCLPRLPGSEWQRGAAARSSCHWRSTSKNALSAHLYFGPSDCHRVRHRISSNVTCRSQIFSNFASGKVIANEMSVTHRCNPRVKRKVEATAGFKFTASSSGLNLELCFEFRGEVSMRWAEHNGDWRLESQLKSIEAWYLACRETAI